jgi:hypothetical protein
MLLRAAEKLPQEPGAEKVPQEPGAEKVPEEPGVAAGRVAGV